MKLGQTRRGFLQTSVVAGMSGLSGCGNDGTESSESRNTVTVPSGGTVTPHSPQFYQELGVVLINLRRPWRETVSVATNEMVDRLRMNLVNLLRPGVSDFLPSSVGRVKSLIDQTVTAFDILRQQQQNFAREEVRAVWRTVSRDQLQPYYSRLGYSYEDSGNQPYFPLFTVLINDLDSAYLDQSQETISLLNEHANQVHTVLGEFILPRMDFQTTRAKALVNTLELLDVNAKTIVNATEEITPATEEEEETQTPQRISIDGFESGAFDDGNPVTWQVKSPGEYIEVQNGISKQGEYALEMKSGEADENHAKLYHRSDDGVIEDGDIFSVWLRAEGRTFYRLSNKPSGGGPHSIRAGVVSDNNNLLIQTSGSDANQIAKFDFGSANSRKWYYFEMEMQPSQSELLGRVYDASMDLIAEEALDTSGASNLEYTTLHVPTPFGFQDRGWFDDVSFIY